MLNGEVDGSGLGFSQQRLELGEDLLDGIEIGTIGRQEEELGADGAQGGSHGDTFVAAEIVHDHDVAGLEGWQQELVDPGEEADAIDGAVEQTGRGNAVVSEGGEEGHRRPAAVRRLGGERLSPAGPTVAPGHVGLGPGLIDEHQPARIDAVLVLLPPRPPTGDVRPILLAGEQAFF